MWVALLALGLALGVVCGGAWLWSALDTPYRGYEGDGVFVEVQKGTTSRGIARLLAESGVIRNRLAFDLLCRVRGRQKLQAGEYRFERPMTALEVFRTIAEGRVYVRSITIPEGWTVFDIAGYLEREAMATREAFLRAAQDISAAKDIAPRARSLEGFLFPATYQFPRRTAAQTIVNAMVARFRVAWTGLAGSRERDNVAEIVTLASLVEREARVPEERALIAGVYLNRLKRGMALQCDPTVIYALELAGKWDGKIGYADLKYKSPYNTYLNRGLPPGPIANPGAASLRAALEPAQTDYLYFVADTQGRHFFSKTLEEHNRNVKRYLRLLVQERSGTPSNALHSAPSRGKMPRTK